MKYYLISCSINDTTKMMFPLNICIITSIYKINLLTSIFFFFSQHHIHNDIYLKWRYSFTLHFAKQQWRPCQHNTFHNDIEEHYTFKIHHIMTHIFPHQWRKRFQISSWIHEPNLVKQKHKNHGGSPPILGLIEATHRARGYKALNGLHTSISLMHEQLNKIKSHI